MFWRGKPSFSWHPQGGHSAIQPGPMPLAWCGIWTSSHSQTTSARSPTCFVKVGAGNNRMRLALAREAIQIFSGTPVTLSRATLVRKIARASPGPQLAILLGSFFSPAAFSKRRDVHRNMSKCPWCDFEMADQEHIFCNCSYRKTTRGPIDDLERRFGLAPR